LSPLTVFLGRYIGVAMLLMCLALLARPKASIAAIASLMDQPGVLLITGVFTMAGGAALVVGHDIWSGGALAIAVTLVGWLSLLKGLAILVVPAPAMARVYSSIGYPGSFRLVMAMGALFAAWLAWAAFTTQPSAQI
jgi:hypothetical protein